MTQAALPVARLRDSLQTTGLDGWYIGREDMFQGEEVPPSEERLAFVSGFTGSAGYGVVMSESAALFSDGRYTLQMASQSDAALWSTHTLPDASLSGWLKQADGAGKRIGVDPCLVTVAGFRRLEKSCRDAGATLVAHADNPIDAIWGTARPQAGAARPFRMPDRVAGQSMADKLAALDKKLADAGADAVVISRVDAVNWLTNIRGHDLANTPVNLVFALYHRENGLLLLGDIASLAPVMEGDLANEAAVAPLDQFDALIDPRAGYGDDAVIWFEPASLPQSMHAPLAACGAQLVEKDCPVTAMKALKNTAELAGTRRAHIEDGAVMVRFLHWLSTGGGDGMTETAIADHLLNLRQRSPRFIASSFDTICGSGHANGMPLRTQYPVYCFQGSSGSRLPPSPGLFSRLKYVSPARSARVVGRLPFRLFWFRYLPRAGRASRRERRGGARVGGGRRGARHEAAAAAESAPRHRATTRAGRRRAGAGPGRSAGAAAAARATRRRAQRGPGGRAGGGTGHAAARNSGRRGGKERGGEG